MSSKKLSFKLESTKDLISSHGGLILLGGLFNKLDLSNRLDKIFGKPQSNNGYSASSYILPLLLKLHGGGRYLEDVRQIKSDKLLCKLLCLPKIPTPASIGVWLRSKGRDSGLKHMGKINKYILHKALALESRKSYTLDIDATEIIANKRLALYTYKKNKGYMPIIGHLAENRMIVGSEFRSGNISPGTKNYEFMRSCIRNMPKHKYINAFRADSASCQNEIINYCNDNGIGYAIGGILNTPTIKAISLIDKKSWSVFEDGEISETIHNMDDSNHEFRLIVKRKVICDDLLGKEYKYHIVISNRLNESSLTTMRWYNKRGNTSENRIKELKNGFNMKHLPCGQHNANAMYFYIGCLAYNLSIIFNSYNLPPEFRNHKISTIRWRVYQIAVKLVRRGRTLYLKVSQEYLQLFAYIKNRSHNNQFG